MGYLPHQLVQDFFHQQYHRWLNFVGVVRDENHGSNNPPQVLGTEAEQFSNAFLAAKSDELKNLGSNIQQLLVRFDHGPRAPRWSSSSSHKLGMFLLGFGFLLWRSCFPKAAEWQEDDWVQALEKCQSFQKQLTTCVLRW